MKIKKQFFSGVVRVFWISLAGVLILSLGMVNHVRAVGVPDLTVASSHTGNFDQGGVGSYTITVTNLGTATGPTDGITAITVTDALPAGLTATGMGGDGWTCPVPVDGIVPPPLTCTRTDVSTILTIGNSYPDIILDVAVAADAAVDTPYILTNEVAVSGGGEANTSNNTDSDNTTITQKPDLEITMVDSGDFVQGGVNKTYTITVKNVGHAPTNGTAIIVSNFSVDPDLSVNSIAGTNWTCDSGLTCTRNAGHLTLNVGDSFDDIILTVDVHVDAGATVTNQADLSGDDRGGDVNLSNNSASRAASVIQKPDLTVAKTHTGNFTEGGVGTYTITIKNSNLYVPTDGAAPITVTDTLPAGLTATGMSGTGWTCPVPVNGIVPAPLTCTHPGVVLAAGASLPDTITVTVNVAVNAAASITNTATVSGGGQVNTLNDSYLDPTTIDLKPELDLTNVNLNPDPPILGQGFVAQVTGLNRGGADSGSIVSVYAFVDPDTDPAHGLWPLTCSWVPDNYNFYTSNLELDDPIGAGQPINKDIAIGGLSAGTHKIYFYADPACIVDESDEENNDFGPIVVNIIGNHTISGNVGMAGVSLSYIFDGITKTAISDANGNYSISVTSNSSGIVTPMKAGYVYSPSSRSYVGVTVDQVNQNFITKSAFDSVAAQDGWILETAENGNKGGTMNNTLNALYLGDDKVRKQYRSILSFNTAGLPDNATVTNVILKIRRSVVGGGGNPITILGGFMADVRKGFFGASILQLTDFQAPAQMTVGPFIPALVNGWYTINLTSAKTLVDKSGTIQIRLRFKLDDNNDSRSNIMSFYSSNAGPVAYHPFLLVTYTLP